MLDAEGWTLRKSFSLSSVNPFMSKVSLNCNITFLRHCQSIAIDSAHHHCALWIRPPIPLAKVSGDQTKSSDGIRWCSFNRFKNCSYPPGCPQLDVQAAYQIVRILSRYLIISQLIFGIQLTRRGRGISCPGPIHDVVCVCQKGWNGWRHVCCRCWQQFWPFYVPCPGQWRRRKNQTIWQGIGKFSSILVLFLAQLFV